MNDCPDRPSEAETPAPLEQEARALARSQQRLATTQELVQIGLRLARKLETNDSPAGEIALAFSRIARAVRMTLALEAMIDGDVQVRIERVRSEKQSRATFERLKKAADEEQLIRDAVGWAINADAADRKDPRETERLFGALDEILTDEDEWSRWANCTLGEIMAEICRELDVPFDVNLWLDQEEGPEEAADQPDAVADDPVDRDDGLDQVLARASNCEDRPARRRPP
jgi:hypothetical protein